MTLSVPQLSGQFLKIFHVGDNFNLSSSILNQDEIAAHQQALVDSQASWYPNFISIYNDRILHQATAPGMAGGYNFSSNRDWEQNGIAVDEGDPTAGYIQLRNYNGQLVRIDFSWSGGFFGVQSPGNNIRYGVLTNNGWNLSYHELFLDNDSGEGAYISSTVLPSTRMYDPFQESMVSVVNGMNSTEVLLIDAMGNTTATPQATIAYNQITRETQFQHDGNFYTTFYYIPQERIIFSAATDENNDGAIHGGYQIRRGFNQKDIYVGNGSVFSGSYSTTNTTSQFVGYDVFVSDPYDELTNSDFQSEALGLVFADDELNVGGIQNINHTLLNDELSAQFLGYELEVDIAAEEIILSEGGTSIFESVGDVVSFVDPSGLSEFHDATFFNLASTV